MILVLPTRNKDCQVHLTAGDQVPLVISAFQSVSHPRVRPSFIKGTIIQTIWSPIFALAFYCVCVYISMCVCAPS